MRGGTYLAKEALSAPPGYLHPSILGGEHPSLPGGWPPPGRPWPPVAEPPDDEPWPEDWFKDPPAVAPAQPG